MAIGNLNFISPLKIVAIDLERNPVEYGTFETGKICGTSTNRKNVQLKEPKGQKYTLVDNLDNPPLCYLHLYTSSTRIIGTETKIVNEWHLINYVEYKTTIKEKTIISTFKQILKNRPSINSHLYKLHTFNETVKKYKTIYYLKEKVYFYWTKHQFNLLPMEIQTSLIPQTDIKKRNTWDERPVKKMSFRTRSKIEAKLTQWHAGVMEYRKYSPEKINFYFWTFTVTTRNFSHEKTMLAWQRFLNNCKMKYRTNAKNPDPFNYLWVVELQDGKRLKETALKYFAMANQPSPNMKAYQDKAELWQQKSLNPTNNLHYHIVFDKRYDLKEMQNLWLDCLEFYGASRYTSTGANAQPVMAEKIVSDNRCIARYLSKYVSKNDAELKCQLWHCSRNISQLATSVANCGLQITKMKQYIDDLNSDSIHYVKSQLDKFKKSVTYCYYKVMDSGNVIFRFNSTPKWLAKLCKPLIDFNINILFPPTPTLFLP